MNIYIDILLIKNIYNGHMVGAGADPKDVVIPGLKDEVHARNRRRHCAGKLSVILLSETRYIVIAIHKTQIKKQG